MHDEFSPSGPILDHNAYFINDGYPVNGKKEYRIVPFENEFIISKPATLVPME